MLEVNLPMATSNSKHHFLPRCPRCLTWIPKITQRRNHLNHPPPWLWVHFFVKIVQEWNAAMDFPSNKTSSLDSPLRTTLGVRLRQGIYQACFQVFTDHLPRLGFQRMEDGGWDESIRCIEIGNLDTVDGFRNRRSPAWYGKYPIIQRVS